MDESLALAIIHLRWFRAKHDAGDVIDPESGLTAADLDRVFEALRRPYPPDAAVPVTIVDLGDAG